MVGTYNACVMVVGEDKALIVLVEVAEEYLNKVQTSGMLKYFPNMLQFCCMVNTSFAQWKSL